MAIAWSRVPSWLFRAWPVWALLPVGLLHLASLHFLPAHSIFAHKLTGTVLQLVGALLVLVSINGNLGLFRSQSLPNAVLNWFQQFPVVQPPITLSAEGLAAGVGTATMSATVTRKNRTLEERLLDLEQRVEQVRSEFELALQRGAERLEAAKSEVRGEIGAVARTMSALSSRVEESTVGGFKLQVLGVLLALYGSVVNVLA